MNEFLEQLRLVVSSGVEGEQRARRAAEMIRAARNYRWVGIYHVLEYEIAVIGWTGDAPALPRFPRTQGLNGESARTGAPVVVNDVSRDPRYLTTFGSTRSEMIVPIRSSGGQIRGTIDVESDRVNAFGEDDVRFVEQCAMALARIFEPD